MTDLRIKRVYEPFEPGDDFRVLVDRLWPRGFTKQKLHADLWLKEIPQTMTCASGSTRIARGGANSKPAALPTKPAAHLLNLAAHGTETFLYAGRDADNNHAAALVEYHQQMYRK